MTEVRQGWLVARREIRERGRSRAFRVSIALMVVAVAAILALPALLRPGGTKDIGLTGPAPPGLPAAIQAQAHAAGTTARIHRYASLTGGEQAVRQGHLDVLVAGARQLEWKGQADEQLKAVVTSAIQRVTVRDRAAAAGIPPDAVAALIAPVPVTSVELGSAAGRSPADELAVTVMTGVLLLCISVFGQMVLTGVLEEKASRVVEVLLARVPARAVLAGKIAGIGLLGLAQIAVIALAALVTVTIVGSIHLPAVRGGVLAWALVWFVLGYALYATMYGALGSLGSRTEDAQSVAGPATVVLLVAYFASFFMIAQPASAAAQAVSYFPLTAPLAMPGRIAMGATAWWEPVFAAVLALAAIIGLVLLAGRIYTNAILHSGPRLSLKDAWRSTTTSSPGPAQAKPPETFLHRIRTRAGGRGMATTDLASHRVLITVLTGIGIALGATVAVLTSDVILGVIAGAGFIAVAIQMVKLWARPGPPVAHR